MNKDLLPVSDFLFSKNGFFCEYYYSSQGERERYFSNILK